ncbi:hypothetical protein EB231_32660 [Mesorhizobium sp. NZP2298]|nr:hypothetical protein EB231_32660 [Mesorhizobium sp. NZP2298]
MLRSRKVGQRTAQGISVITATAHGRFPFGHANYKLGVRTKNQVVMLAGLLTIINSLRNRIPL